MLLDRSRITRLARYLSWSVADQVVLLGVPRLVLFPILAVFLGENIFGSFVIALGLIQLVGLAPSNGLIGYVIRDLVHENDRDQAVLLRTTLLLSAAVVLPFTIVFIFAARPITGLYDNNPSVLTLLPLLGVFLLLTNIVETSLSAYRVRRAFGHMTLVHAVQTAALFLAIPLYHAGGIGGVGLAHVIASAAALIVVLVLERKTLLAAPFFASRFALAAMRVWPAFSLSALIALSAGYLDRLLLGYWWSPAAVAPFFAAVSTASMIAVPATVVANMTLSILGRMRGAQGFDRRFYIRYAVGALAASLVVFFIGSVVGEFLLRLFYRDFADAAVPLWNYALAGFALLNVSILLRPFVSKFLSPAALPLLSFASLVARLVPLLLLVPRGGAAGAVRALFIGGLVTAALWATLFLRSFVFTRNSPALADSVATADSTNEISVEDLE
jgi:O-antigen/teichoic acid export membrane protein